MASVKGVKKLQDRLRRLDRLSHENIAAASLKSANLMAEEMRRIAPKDDGDLIASIRVQPRKRRSRNGKLEDGNETSVAVTAGDKDAYYAHMVEFGTAPHVNKGRFAGTQHPGTPPQPFFYPTWRASQKRALSAVRRALNKALRGVEES